MANVDFFAQTFSVVEFDEVAGSAMLVPKDQIVVVSWLQGFKPTFPNDSISMLGWSCCIITGCLKALEVTIVLYSQSMMCCPRLPVKSLEAQWFLGFEYATTRIVATSCVLLICIWGAGPGPGGVISVFNGFNAEV
jgi:hypothetical protein